MKTSHERPRRRTPHALEELDKSGKFQHKAVKAARLGDADAETQTQEKEKEKVLLRDTQFVGMK